MTSQPDQTRPLPSWSLCIATLNRRQALLAAIDYALQQTCPPQQIVVVDVSDDWAETRDMVVELLARARAAGGADIALDYQTSTIRSSATQRNEAIARATGDILFLLDDDSFLYPDSAEHILRVYGADTQGHLAGLGIALSGALPPKPGLSLPPQKESGRRSGLASLQHTVLRSRLGRWFNRKVLLQDPNELFLRYDGPRRGAVPDELSGFGLHPVSMMSGCAVTVRRPVALEEPFESAMRYYAAFEDLDVTYRYAGHGMLFDVPAAKLHHFEAAGGRVKRKKLVAFQLFNMAVVLKRNAARPEDWVGPYRRLLWRRLFGEMLKDFLSGRFDFPQVGGVRLAMRRWREVWNCPTDQLDDWYPTFQKSVLDAL